MWVVGLLVLGAFGAGFWLRPHLWHAQGSDLYPGATPCHAGPWGELNYTPISIAVPDELLPVRAVETKPVVWFWGGCTVADIARFLTTAGVSEDQLAQLLPAGSLTLKGKGIEVRPVRDAVLSLAPAVREKIYKQLVQFAENRGDFIYVPTDRLPDLLQRSGVGASAAAQAKQWSCAYGRYTVFYGLSCILASLPTFEDKLHFMKAVSRQPTYLLHLRVTPETDLAALHHYWGKACWSIDDKAFLESLAAVRGGTWLDIIELLPPLPTSLLYTSPMPQNPLNGPVLIHDCHWTAFNFFRDPPDERYAQPAFVFQHLKEDYFPVQSDPRYGDLVLLTKPDGDIIHSAVYLADNFLFSKNGEGDLHPWIIASLPDLLEKYSFQVPPEQKLNVVYFRNKYY